MTTESTPTAGTRRHTLGLVIARGEGERLRPLVRHLARNPHIDIIGSHSDTGPPDALLVSSPAALSGIPERWSGRIAVWSAAPDPDGSPEPDEPHPVGTGDMLVVGPADAVVTALDDPTDTSVIRIPVARGLMELPEWDPMPTLVRARWRSRLDWPSIIVVPPGYGESTIATVATTTSAATARATEAGSAQLGTAATARPADPTSRAGTTGRGDTTAVNMPTEIGQRITLLGLASVAVVDASTLPLAVALTTPCVCTDPIDDPDLAAIVPTQFADIRAAIAAADALADTTAATAQATRLLKYRQSHGVGAAADALQSALQLDDTPDSLAALTRQRCRELDCPSDSPLASRITEHFALFAPSTPATGPVS